MDLQTHSDLPPSPSAVPASYRRTSNVVVYSACPLSDRPFPSPWVHGSQETYYIISVCVFIPVMLSNMLSDGPWEVAHRPAHRYRPLPGYLDG